MGSEEAALAGEVFDQFCSANTLKSILGHFRHLCTLLHLQPTHFPHFYPKLKSKLRSWKAQALWNKFDKRASHKCYSRGKACSSSRILVIGAGPCGLRAAIEAQLLGAKVVVVEKRDRLSRNNVLHLWPFVIHDLRGLGAKKFFGRFCAGAIDHISIRQLQCILLKVALIFGVEIHEGVSFEDLRPPPDDQDRERIGWRAYVDPKEHPVSQYEFDVLIGADGKRNTLDGFKRKEFRGKLAIAITANFINRHSMAEARVEEISGVAFIFNQKFFKELYASTGIDLENIVYYKDETHYFVMTAKKHSLIDKGVISNDYAETARLLAVENVDKEALMDYAKEAADFSTGYQLPQMEFALNHYGQPDVAMFDFTSMYAAENASRVMESHGHRLLVMLVGDSLLEPFWPTGSGCARGFLSSMDACWAVRSWAQGLHPLQVLAERESIYRLLGQTTPENLHRDLNSYTLDPHTRYPNLNTSAVLAVQVKGLLKTDDPASVEQFLKAPSLHLDIPKKKRRRGLDGDAVLGWLRRQTEGYPSVIVDGVPSLRDGLALCALIHHYRPHLLDFDSLNKQDVATNNQLAFDILEKELAIPPVVTGEEMVGSEVPDKLTIISYLSQVYDAFRGEIPHIKHPKLEESEVVGDVRSKVVGMSPAQRQALLSKLAKTTRRTRKSDRDSRGGDEIKRGGVGKDLSGRVKELEAKLRGQAQEKKPRDLLRAIGKIEKTDWNVKEIEKKIEENRMGRGTSKQKAEKVPKWSKEQFEDKFSAVEKKLKGREYENKKYAEIDMKLEKLEKRMREGGCVEPGKVSAMAAHLATVHTEPPPPALHKTPNGGVVMAVASEVCHFCGKRVYLMERLSAEGKFFHRGCFKCAYCSTTLRLGNYLFDREGKYGSRFFCMQHFGLEGSAGKRQKNADRQTPPQPPLALPLDEGDTTPERIEFENLSDCVEVEEDDWTDTNFGASDSSDLSDCSSSESEDGAFAEALEEGLNAEETLRLARDWTRLYAQDSDDTHPSYQESDEDESETATEGEEEVKARELRKKEVPKETSKKQTPDTGSETEVGSDDYSSSCEGSEPEDNSATEISTDSEFEHDGTTQHIPDIIITDVVQVRRGQLEQPKKVQLVTAHQLNGNVQRPTNEKQIIPVRGKTLLNTLNNNEENNEKIRASILERRGGDYLLNRTQSTEGIASKISLELKKKYLLGPNGASGAVKKSGSTSTLDSKFKSLIDQISEQQKLLNPAPEPSATMQAILQGADKIRSSPNALLKKRLPLAQQFRHVCGLGQQQEPPPKKLTEEEEYRPRSPVHETSIVVPEFPRNEEKEPEMESDSLSSEESTTSEESNEMEAIVPKLEIHNSRGELMEEQSTDIAKTTEWAAEITEKKGDESEENKEPENPKEEEEEYGYVEEERSREVTKAWSEGGRITEGWGRVVVPGEESSLLLKQVTTPAELFVSEDTESPPSTPSPRDDSDSQKNETGGLTETEMSDWAREEDTMVSDTLDDLETDPHYGLYRTERGTRSGRGALPKSAGVEDLDEEVPHICGKRMLEEIERLEWADTGGEEESTLDPPPNSGYVRFVDTPDDAPPSATVSEPTTVENSPDDFQEYVNRLRGRISPFADVRDSIDVRKARRKSPLGVPSDCITTQQKLEKISKERAMQKDLIHEMVLNKVLSERGQNKRLSSRSPIASSTSLSSTASPSKPKQEKEPLVRPKSVVLETPIRQRSSTVNNSLYNKKGTPGCSLPDLTSPHLRNQMRETARARVRMMSDQDLGLSPEEKLRRLREKLNLPSKADEEKKKGKATGGKEERKKSIIQAVQDFFKKSPSPPKTPSSQSPTKLFKFTKSKDKSSAPAVPPLPHTYSVSQEDSLSEEDSKATTEERSSRKQRRLAKQAQHKRLRMAQEMQRQLEELEVKQRELEAQGVFLEKALRGEHPDAGKEDEELLREWFQLVRQRTDVRRYENELMVRAQELELDDRHSRLQHQLKALLANSSDGTKEVALEGRILREMLEIVERRSALSAQLESERERYQEEDKDLEAQMLAKGLRLTPLSKSH